MYSFLLNGKYVGDLKIILQNQISFFEFIKVYSLVAALTVTQCEMAPYSYIGEGQLFYYIILCYNIKQMYSVTVPLFPRSEDPCLSHTSK